MKDIPAKNLPIEKESTARTSKQKKTNRSVNNTNHLATADKSKQLNTNNNNTNDSNDQEKNTTLKQTKQQQQQQSNRAEKEKTQPKTGVNEDGSSLGVYMTMDELSELVKAVKENAKGPALTTTAATNLVNENNNNNNSSGDKQHKYNQSNDLRLDLPSSNDSDYSTTKNSHPGNDSTITQRDVGGLLSDKKRQQWLREKAEIDRMKLEVQYDQLKHQLTPSNDQPPSPGRPKYGYVNSFSSKPPTTTVPPAPPLPKSLSSDNVGYKYMHKVEDDNKTDIKTQLMEKKQQQWKQENAEKMPVWNPFGKPGAGAPSGTDNNARTNQQPNQNSAYNSSIPIPVNTERSTTTSHQAPSQTYPKSQFRLPIDEDLYKNNNSNDIRSFSTMFNDQTRVPAAMRTNLLFGDVRFDDQVQMAKEVERKQWLDGLKSQIEDNKKKQFTIKINERKQDVLQEQIQPFLERATQNHYQNRQHNGFNQENISPRSNGDRDREQPPQNSQSSSDIRKLNHHENVVKQTYDKIVEASKMAEFEKRSQLIEKLKRGGHQVDKLQNTLPEIRSQSNNITTTNLKSGEKLFGPNYESSNYNNSHYQYQNKMEPLNIHSDSHKRDEAVNTIDSSFRSDNSSQTDIRMPPNKQVFPSDENESDLPPQVPKNLSHYPRNKKSVRIKSLDDEREQEQQQYPFNTNYRSPTSFRASENENNTVDLSSPFSTHDLVHRPKWNYQNPAYRQYIPNSKRDPFYEKRQRIKHFENGNYENIDDVQKRTCYNRWNSDSELVNQQRKTNQQPYQSQTRTRSTLTRNNNQKDKGESIMNLLKSSGVSKHHPYQHQQTQQHDAFSTGDKNNNDDLDYDNISLDKYENHVPPARNDEILDSSNVQPSVINSGQTSTQQQNMRDTTRGQQQPQPNNYGLTPQYNEDTQRYNNDYNHSQWDNSSRSSAVPYQLPSSRQEQILQQLSVIKERQKELASSAIGGIPI
ncbi:unnamed protein product [Didymodactylos carnosus]|uniref:Uncharacterized protein n=1 Tax=Didymodactylos carnosus TaxID=1234261 RepID=A0A813XET3_9BILA|nr:unnamed protein product [Didymodactylos carnosus]CAF1083953.1 unnamed protein product [Didymodactylos carnosus]CAF3656463.1 unnamed protein product [Didymodactylos carnosus]CAF3846573.1 unnamed protein product [Didymodactylos carnosus]